MLIAIIAVELGFFLIFAMAAFMPGKTARFLKTSLLMLGRSESRNVNKTVSLPFKITVSSVCIACAFLILADLSQIDIAFTHENIPVFQSGKALDTDNATTQRVKEIVLPIVESGQCAGIAIGIIDGSSKWVIGLGRSSISDSNPPNGDTIFEIGSVTKTFTSLALAAMVENGSINLDEQIISFLPQSVNMQDLQLRSITLCDLAKHTSGLPRLPSNLPALSLTDPYKSYTPENMLQFLCSCKLQNVPGTHYEYSNFGAGLLGWLLCNKYGTTYEVMIHELICQPLDMNDTIIKLSKEQSARLAQGYLFQSVMAGFVLGVPAENWNFQDSFAGAGAVRSTVNDLLKYVAAGMQTDSEMTSAFNLMHTQRFKIDDTLSIGLAWHMSDIGKDEPAIWHNGGTGGYSSFVGLMKNRKIGVILLANTFNVNLDAMGFKLLHELY